jgi:YggT family protein
MGLLVLALEILSLLVLGAVIISWLPPGGELLESVRRFFALSTEWLLGPLRRTIPPVRLGAAALDLSPLIVLIGLQILIGILAS